MDSLTHALYKAVRAADAEQREAEKQRDTGAAVPSEAGLQSISTRETVHRCYAGATPTTLHIALDGRSDEVLALFFEFASAGWAPPCQMLEDGADVLINPEQTEVHVPADDGGHWTAMLTTSSKSRDGTKRASWAIQQSPGGR